jgi:histidinol-phosphate aminotransferase
MDAERLAQPHLRAVSAYTPGEQPQQGGWTKLNTNESPFPPPPEVAAAVADEARALARYPSPTSAPLRAAIAARFSLDARQVIIGNGSDDVLNLLVRAFAGADQPTVQTVPSYSLYPVLTAIAGARLHSVPWLPERHLPVDQLLAERPRMLLLTCPNAPTGIAFRLEELAALADGMADGLLVIDEAYAEFADGDATPLLRSHPQVFITRTFSKAYGLAGLRVGYGMGDPAVVAVLDKIRDSYNVNRLSQAGALAALGVQDEIDRRIATIIATRERVRGVLETAGWSVMPSQTNFLFAAPADRHGSSGAEVAADLFAYLLSRRILVRRFPADPLTAPYLRISIGSDSEMDTFLQAVETWTQSA